MQKQQIIIKEPKVTDVDAALFDPSNGVFLKYYVDRLAPAYDA